MYVLLLRLSAAPLPTEHATCSTSGVAAVAVGGTVMVATKERTAVDAYRIAPAQPSAVAIELAMLEVSSQWLLPLGSAMVTV